MACSLKEQAKYQIPKMKNILIYLILLLSMDLQAQSQKVKWINLEPLIGGTYFAATDTTRQRNTTRILALTFNPHLSIFINQEWEGGIQASYTHVWSDYPNIIEAGQGWGIGYQCRYFPKRLAFKKYITVEKVKYTISSHPYLGFEHSISTIYRDANDKSRFSNHFQAQSLGLAGGLHVYCRRQIFVNFTLGIGYTPTILHKPAYRYSYLSFGYTFQKHIKSTKND